MSKLGIAEMDAEQYRQQEMKFQKYVTGKRMSMAEIREAIGQPVYTLADLPLLTPAQKQIDRVQIYEDMGEGFSEENSFFLEEMGTQQKEFQLIVKDLQHRIRVLPSTYRNWKTGRRINYRYPCR